MAESARYEKLLGRITNDVQLHKFLRSIETAESQLREDLDQYIDSRTHTQEAKKLELSRTELSTTLQNSSELVSRLSNAGSLATKITARVRLLDAERSKVHDTLQYVTQVNQLKSLILTINSALDQQDWESAARAISKTRDLPLYGEFVNSVVPSTDVPDVPSSALDTWIVQLTDLFSQEFHKAADSKDVAKLTKFFSLFPLIGQDSVGLDCYSKFICNIVASQSRLIITNQSQQDRIGFYPAALMKLLEIVSRMLNQHAQVIASNYGLSHMTGIISRVQRETDSQAGLISDTFYDQRNFNRVLDEIQQYSFPYLTNSSNALSSRNTPSPRASAEYTRQSEDQGAIAVPHVGSLASELSSFLNYWSLYCRFIAVKWREYENGSSQTQAELKLPKPLQESAFSKKIQVKFLPTFEVLTTFSSEDPLNKHYKEEEFPDIDPLLRQQKLVQPDEEPPVTSAMEIIILVISNSIQQSIQTGQPVTVKNIISNVKKILDSDYLITIHRRLRELQPKSGSVLQVSTHHHQLQQQQQQQQKSGMGSIFMRGANALNQIAVVDDTKLHTFIILLNTVSLGSVYFEKIIKKNLQILPTNYPFGSDAVKLESIVGNLNEHFQSKSSELLAEHIEILFSQVLKNKLKILLTDCFKDVDYLVSTYDEEENVVTRRFILQWNHLMSPYLKTLYPRVYDQFLLTIVNTLSKLLERKVWSMEEHINELGSIKLERDFSGLIGEITRNRYNLRDSFLRVTQIIMILGFDDEDDEIDMNWVLTPAERQRARRLRVDRN